MIGVVYPYLELAWKCRDGHAPSEACVWGRALMPVSRWIELLIVAPAAFVVLWLAARLAGGTRTRPPADV